MKNTLNLITFFKVIFRYLISIFYTYRYTFHAKYENFSSVIYKRKLRTIKKVNI